MANKINENIVINRILNKCKDMDYEFRGFANDDNSYQGNITYLILYCNKHNHEWKSTYANFIRGRKCKFCGNESKIQNKTIDKTLARKKIEKKCKEKEYIFKCFKNEKNEYQKWDDRLLIYCDKHQYEWEVSYTNFVNGSINSPCCKGGIALKEKDVINKINDKCTKLNYTFKGFIGNKYKNNKTKLILFCNKHSYEWYPIYSDFICRNSGCPICRESKIEKEVVDILKINLIKFERWYKDFDWLKNKKTNRKLELDFYLPDYNIAIECQGGQHFRAIKQFGGIKGYEKIKYRDQIKRELCENHNLALYYIKYNDNIKSEMNKILNLIK